MVEFFVLFISERYFEILKKKNVMKFGLMEFVMTKMNFP